MKKYPIALLCGIAAVAVTVILYFTIFGGTVLGVLHYLTLGAVVLSEIITTAYAMLSKGKPRRVAAAFVSAVLIPVAIGLSWVYLVNFPCGYRTYIGWYSAAAVAVNTIALILVFLDKGKAAGNGQLQNAKTQMRQMRNLVLNIAALPAAKPFAERLQKLEENLRFSNDAVIAKEDQRIYQLLMQLQNNPSEEALLTELEQLVQQRTVNNRYSN